MVFEMGSLLGVVFILAETWSSQNETSCTVGEYRRYLLPFPLQSSPPGVTRLMKFAWFLFIRPWVPQRIYKISYDPALCCLCANEPVA
jgi:hypothetical protein